MATALTLMHPAKPKRQQPQRISQLEAYPAENWFVSAMTPKGRRIWHCRFTITGLFPRLYGPFSTKRKALRFHDAAISTLGECWAGIDDARDKHSCEGEFQKLHWGPLIEHPLLTAHQTQTSKKGR